MIDYRVVFYIRNNYGDENLLSFRTQFPLPYSTMKFTEINKKNYMIMTVDHNHICSNKNELFYIDILVRIEEI